MFGAMTLLVTLLCLVTRARSLRLSNVPQKVPLDEPMPVTSRRPHYARVDGSIETVWQLPHVHAPPIRGILFAAHGCHHQATDFFADRGHDCWALHGCKKSNFGRCLGLPEERDLVDAARKRGYVVVAVSGTGGSRCWNMQHDPERVARAIRYVLANEKLPTNTTVFATGASSGGAFMGYLVHSDVLGSQLKCIAPQISSTLLGKKLVPSFFVHMTRDRRTAEGVAKKVEEMRNRGVQVQELRVTASPVTAKFLSRGMSRGEAEAVVRALKEGGLVDDKDLLKTDPRGSRWRDALRKASAVPSNDTLKLDQSSTSELLNVAWAQHEITAQYTDTMLDFCESATSGRSASQGG
eukprot:gnl/TRDRNA2_/TRDRNA2_156163_c0_seq2.p1 gnl/TRDRNA2_/TRDRNA2_156163_c0~~gnl/TRDRNA2_/TRDRNA2_156163_c0_seq2.p1  ORF type:complete len:352 (-),score=36.45 gnl/TRDRNA2_/TRDRNA2_156163_c0_seq2:41-1096(-)